MAATQANIDAVKLWLPTDGSPVENGWNDVHIGERWTGHVSTTVRAYWFQRVSDTAGYLDLPDPGGTLPITQIYRQAREMLAYWDAMLAKYGAATDPNDYNGARASGVGRIKKRYVNERRYPVARFPSAYSPYNPSN